MKHSYAHLLLNVRTSGLRNHTAVNTTAKYVLLFDRALQDVAPPLFRLAVRVATELSVH